MKITVYCLFWLAWLISPFAAVGAPVVSSEKPSKQDGWRMEETKQGYFQGLGYKITQGRFSPEFVDCPPPPWLSLPVAEDQIVRSPGGGWDKAQKMPLSELRRGVMLTGKSSISTSTETLVINSNDWWKAERRFTTAANSYWRNRIPDPPKVELVCGNLPGGQGRWLLSWGNDPRQGTSFRRVIIIEEDDNRGLTREQFVIWSRPNRGGEVMGIFNGEISSTN